MAHPTCDRAEQALRYNGCVYPDGAILGHAGRRRISRTGARGAGMALAGTIVGWITAAIGAAVLMIVLVIVLFILLITHAEST